VSMRMPSLPNISNPKRFFRDKRVLVMGLGLHGGGVGIVKFLTQNGAKVTITDLRSKKELQVSIAELKHIRAKYVLGRHRKEDFQNADLIIKNPAIPRSSPYLKLAHACSTPIDTDIGIFFELCPAPIIGITGTKGKSTTVSLLYSIFRAHSKNTVLAGNIGTSALESLSRINKHTRVVLELSSWQLEGLLPHKKSPAIALITNILPDHLNTYKSFTEYIAAKKLIYRFQKPTDILLLNFDDSRVKTFAKKAPSRILFFSKTSNLSSVLKNKSQIGAFVLHNKIVFGPNKKQVLLLKDLKIRGEHNIMNVLGAVSIALRTGVPLKIVESVLGSFRGIPSRLELIATIKKRKFINDTTATMPDSTIAAINTLDSERSRNIILIAGGEDKNLNYKRLSQEIITRVKHLILLPGTASQKIKTHIKRIDSLFLKNKTDQVQTMKKAVQKAWRKSQPGDIILLSPGAASFNMFKNEFDRGEQFVNAVDQLKSGEVY